MGTVLVLAGVLVCLRRERHEARVGAIVSGQDDSGRVVSFRIDSIEVDPRDPTGSVHLYGVSILVGDVWTQYCGPDVEGRRAAIPLAGSWGADGQPIVDAGPNALTFACTGGAIGKCVRLGYRPWLPSDAGVAFADLHAACVRLVRADYCGTGHGHTRDGTRIDLWDRAGIQVEERSSPFVEDFEAGWSPSGATYLNVPRWDDDVAAIVAECPERLAGRTSLGARLTPAEVAQRFPETMMFNKRMHNPGDRMASPPAR